MALGKTKIILVCVVVTSAGFAQPLRYFSVRDSIEMVRFNSGQRAGLIEADTEANFSPDGRLFFVVTNRGDLRSNQMEATIWLFDCAAIKEYLASSETKAPRPKALATLNTSSNGEPISDARWDEDSKTIAFLGRRGGVARHLFVVNIHDAALKEFNPDGEDVVEFDRVNGESVLSSVPAVDDSQLYQSAGPAISDVHIGTGKSLFDLLYPEWQRAHFGLRPRRLWQVRSRKPVPVIQANGTGQISLLSRPYPPVFSLSPDGRYLIAPNLVEQIPSDWEFYEPGFANTPRFIADRPGLAPVMSEFRASQFVLIDLQTGKVSPLFHAPLGVHGGYGDVNQAIWSPDGQSVAVSNTYMAWSGPNASGRHLRPCVAVVTVTTGKADCVKETSSVDMSMFDTLTRLVNMEWRERGEQLVLNYAQPNRVEESAEIFKRQNGVWNKVQINEAGAVRGRPLVVEVQQSINQPPILSAMDSTTKVRKKIWDPNPQFADIQLGEASVYHWKDNAGHEWAGGLVKPPGFVVGRRYPLLLQTHGFNPREFLTDGFIPTANAAREIAAKGIVVLQIGEIRTKNFGTIREAEVDSRSGYESAIEHLADEGIIDRQKIGIIGFSRSGWYVLDALIHLPKQFMAATLAESTYQSMGEYLVNADYMGRERAKSIEEAIGNKPFGDGVQKWLESSPGFNTNKIQAPILFEANDPVGLIYAWDMYASLRLQGKPVDLLYFRNGTHGLVRPMERLISQEMSVDWYDFWLNGHGDPNPSKREQYARWRELRKLQDSSTKPIEKKSGREIVP